MHACMHVLFKRSVEIGLVRMSAIARRCPTTSSATAVTATGKRFRLGRQLESTKGTVAVGIEPLSDATIVVAMTTWKAHHLLRSLHLFLTDWAFALIRFEADGDLQPTFPL